MKDSPEHARSSAVPAGNPDRFVEEIRRIRALVAEISPAAGEISGYRLPGDAAFLPDGRVLCLERLRGDSRYPYGKDGFNFWVSATGRMHSNDGLFFVFLPSSQGCDPAIAFFAGYRGVEQEEFTPLSLLPTPFLKESESTVDRRYSVIGPDATYFITQTAALNSSVRVFVDQLDGKRAQTNFSLLIENPTAEDVCIYTSTYMNPFCRHQFTATNEDQWFKKVWLQEASKKSDRPSSVSSGSSLQPFIVAVNEDVSRFKSITNHAIVHRCVGATDSAHSLPLQQSVCTSHTGYLGSPRRSLASASFLESGRFSQEPRLTVFNDHAIVGDLIQTTLPAGAWLRLDYTLVLVPNDGDVEEWIEQRTCVDSIDAALARTSEQTSRNGSGWAMEVKGSDDDSLNTDAINHFLPYLKNQVAVCAQIKGYMHPSPNSLIGIRDVLQAIEGHLLDRPGEAKEKIREALNFVLVDGRCPRQYSLPVNGHPGRADLREFIDQGVWVISTIYTYLATTGDYKLLNATVGYHKLSETEASVIEPAGDEDTVLEHLIRIMDYLDRNRDAETRLLRALYGDWNDALDGLGVSSEPGKKFGSGVSVMASLQLYKNCSEMIEILSYHYPGRFLDKRQQYERMRDELKAGLQQYAITGRNGERRILHGWGDLRSYFVGGYEDSDGLARDGLTSNAFWVISSMIEQDPSIKKDILAAMHRLDSPYGLMTFAPGFQPDTPGVGRIPKLPIGTAENGATYIHATAFGIMALFMMGEPRFAWEQIRKILPFAPHQTGISHSPFIMPNSYVHNPELNLSGQNMNDWQTGSSNALLKVLVRNVCGFQPTFEALHVAPAQWSPFERIAFSSTVHNRRVELTIRRGSTSRRQITLNGEAWSTTHASTMLGTTVAEIPYDQLDQDKANRIEVIDPQ